MKITIEHEYSINAGEDFPRIFSLKTADCLNIYDMLDEFRLILVIMGYEEESIKRVFDKINR